MTDTSMVYFLSFGVAFLALHTISILFVTRISLVKRLFLAVWMMLFVVGAPFLYSTLPTMLFIAVCVMAISLYLVLLFSQELAPVRKKTVSSRGRRQKHAKGRRRRQDAAASDLDLTDDVSFAAAAGNGRKERGEEVLFEGSSALQQASAGPDSGHSAKDDMTRYRQTSPLYGEEQLATVPALDGLETDYQEDRTSPAVTTERVDYSQTANDDFLESLLAIREGTTTKIKVSNSLIADAVNAGELDQDGYTDIEDPAFETAVLAKIRPVAYAESDYGGVRPFISEVSQVSGEIYRKENLDRPVQEEPAAETATAATGGLADLFSAAAAPEAAADQAQSTPAADDAGRGDSLESLFFSPAEQDEPPLSQAAEVVDSMAAAFDLKPVQADQASLPEETQELHHVLDQIQLDLLGTEDLDEGAAAWANQEPADDLTAGQEAQPAPVSQPLREESAAPAANESEEDLLKKITDILQAEEAAGASPATPALAEDKSEADLLRELTGILGEAAPAAAAPAPAESSQPAGDKEVYYQFLLLESQELLATRAYQEAESYLKEILIGSSDQKIRQEALNMLDKLEKI